MIEFSPESSFIEKVTYEPDPSGSQEMIVYFKNGKTDQYLDVPKWLFDQFKQAESAGKFFNEKIKKGPAFAPENWQLFGKAIEDIKLGDQIEKDLETGRVRVAKFSQLKP